MDLDDPRRYGAVDGSDALADLETTADQWAHARELAGVALDLDDVDTVVVTGMGGSGIGADIVWALATGSARRPVVVHKGYGLPAFVGPRTLVMAASYSGGTEETLSAFAEARRRGARRWAVTVGGALAATCEETATPCVLVPAGRRRVSAPRTAPRPPRHSMGYLLVPALVALGLDEGLDEAIDVLARLGGELGRAVPTADNPAKALALDLAAGGVPLVWGGRGIGAVAAYRLACQLAENAKLPAKHGEVPESCHNEVVAWQEPSLLTGTSGMVAVRDPGGEHPRVAQRFAVVGDLLVERLAWRRDIVAQGRAPLARLASLLLHGDLASVYTALALDRDPTPIANIERLKAALGAAHGPSGAPVADPVAGQRP